MGALRNKSTYQTLSFFSGKCLFFYIFFKFIELSKKNPRLEAMGDNVRVRMYEEHKGSGEPEARGR